MPFVNDCRARLNNLVRVCIDKGIDAHATIGCLHDRDKAKRDAENYRQQPNVPSHGFPFYSSGSPQMRFETLNAEPWFIKRSPQIAFQAIPWRSRNIRSSAAPQQAVGGINRISR